MINELRVYESYRQPLEPERGGVHEELTVRSLLMMLKRRRSRILGIICVFFLLGLTLAIFLNPRYKATGEIQVQKSATDGLGLENLTGDKQGTAADALDENIEMETQAGILQSYSLALKVIDDLQLEKTQDFRPKFNPVGWLTGLISPRPATEPPGTSLDDAPHRRDHAVGVFERHLKIKPQSGTRLIDITYTSTDPKIGAAVVNDLSKSLVDYTLNSRVSATSEVSGWLSNQLQNIKRDAEDRQGKLEQLQRESGVYSLGIPDAEGKEIAYSATLDRLQQATAELSAATSNRILKGALYKTIQNGDPELISGLAGSNLAGASPGVSSSFLLLQNLRTQQATLASQVASDVSKFGTANPRLADDKASLDALNSQIASESQRIGERAANDYRAAETVEDNTRGVYQQAKQAAEVLNSKAIALLIARQEANDARALYQTLYSHLKEAGVIEGLRSSNIAVVDPGRVPSEPIPYALILPVLALLLGCVCGVASALFAESTSNRIEEMTTIENTLRTSIFAVLPELTSAPSQQRKPHGFAALFRKRLGKGTEERSSGEVAVLNGPNSAYVEAIRGLRTSLLHPLDGPAPKTVLITGAGEREGKSTLSLNLAAALALNGSRVLLVDGDMRSHGLSGYLGLEDGGGAAGAQPAAGLNDALAGPKKVAVVEPYPELPRLFAMPAGQVSRYPAELLGSTRMEELMRTWSAEYDYVLIDSPPMLAVSDAMILSRLVDMTLMVTRHGRSTQRSLERAYHMLHDVKGRKVGVVVNGVPRDSVSFNEFYGYSGKRYFGEGVR